MASSSGGRNLQPKMDALMHTGMISGAAAKALEEHVVDGLAFAACSGSKPHRSSALSATLESVDPEVLCVH